MQTPYQREGAADLVLGLSAALLVLTVLVHSQTGWSLLWVWLPVPLAFGVLAGAARRWTSGWGRALAWAGAVYLVVGAFWVVVGPGNDTDAGDPLLFLVWPVVGLQELGALLGWWPEPN